ncbi:MAG: DUF1611 domain-containing protein [Pirellulaceae bacterium]|jgi:uncharacterized NAD-dependent epimerase/dehydratase family protein|nr:DUF1611 domain-containing protein [Pirellulaceae bacterium]
MQRQYAILTEGQSEPHAAKTACSVIRYRGSEVLAVIDSQQVGRTTQEVLGVGGAIPFVASLDDVPRADTLLIGIAPVGGQIPASWRGVILAAIDRGMDVVSGLHDFLADDPEFAAAAQTRGVRLIDVRRNRQRDVARRIGLRPDCLRIHTVGHDCSVGKMVAAIEITNALKRRGHSAKFLATGQTGILVEGDGVPVDCVVADFVSGAIEQLVLQHQHHDFLVIEGQGSLVHPAYSGVTLGLLHGCAPHGLILCYEVGREIVTGVPEMRIPPLGDIKRLNEVMANVMQPCAVIGIAMNGRLVSPEVAAAERQRRREEFQLPVCDVLRDGPGELVDAVLQLRKRIMP